MKRVVPIPLMIFLWALLLSSTFAAPQKHDQKHDKEHDIVVDINFEVSGKVVSLGDIFTVKIMVLAGEEIVLTKPNIVWHEKVVERNFRLQFHKKDNLYTYEYIYNLSAFALGKLSLGSWQTMVKRKLASDVEESVVKKLELKDMEIEVKGYDLKGDEDPKAAEIILPFGFDWLSLTLLSLGVVAFSLTLWFSVKKMIIHFKQKEAHQEFVDLRSPKQYFFDELTLQDQLFQQENSDLRAMLYQVANVFYRYLEKRFTVKLNEKTISDIRRWLEADQAKITSSLIKNKVVEILPLIEKIKYAPNDDDVMSKMRQDFIDKTSEVVLLIEEEFSLERGLKT